WRRKILDLKISCDPKRRFNAGPKPGAYTAFVDSRGQSPWGMPDALVWSAAAGGLVIGMAAHHRTRGTLLQQSGDGHLRRRLCRVALRVPTGSRAIPLACARRNA